MNRTRDYLVRGQLSLLLFINQKINIFYLTIKKIIYMISNSPKRRNVEKKDRLNVQAIRFYVVCESSN